ncbi:hypothetical protein K466DRAFT_587889 [Polyporus arcularius HHB13444]|uniref:Uncharacterized protein n=1 Tax=Polyporus arcularius HHB13444 TaxID=1314778 RepID=A0A5C3P898_9APHY|nr:hypothetical protein K466DRAFT_587889 [Polyporus arcularius HHB13444]
MDFSASVAASKPRRDYKRLTQPAYDMLSNFFYDVSHHPTTVQLQALTDAIRQLPGCEWYTIKKARAYFYQKRYFSSAKARIKPEPSLSPPPLPASLPEPPWTLASPAATATARVVKIEDDGRLERVGLLASKKHSKRRILNAGPMTSSRSSNKTFVTQTSPATSEEISPTIVEFHSTLSNATSQPQLYFYPYSMMYPSVYAPLAIAHGAAQAELRQPNYTWHHPSIPAQPLPFPPPFHTPTSTPASVTLPLIAIRPSDLRLHDLAARLADALTHPGLVPPLRDLPKTLVDLSHRLGDQQASAEFLCAVRGGAYARLGFFPFNALRTARPLHLTD